MTALPRRNTQIESDWRIAHIKFFLQILRLLDNEAIEAEELSEVQSSVTDYLDRNQEDFDFFSCPDDSYEDVLEQLDNLEVCHLPQTRRVSEVNFVKTYMLLQ